jgi:hypothetical protein
MLSRKSNKEASAREKVLLVKKKKHAERTITRLYGAMECKNMLAEAD